MEYQASEPFDPDYDMGNEEQGKEEETPENVTDFSITVESKSEPVQGAFNFFFSRFFF